MNKEQLSIFKEYLEAEGKKLPEYVKEDCSQLGSRIYMAKLLNEMEETKAAYMILRGIYEDNSFSFDKEFYVDYEEYIIEKVKFFEEIAALSLEVTKEPARSIPYLHEALIMLDGMESVYPYINPKDINSLKSNYLKMLEQ